MGTGCFSKPSTDEVAADKAANFAKQVSSSAHKQPLQRQSQQSQLQQQPVRGRSFAETPKASGVGSPVHLHSRSDSRDATAAALEDGTTPRAADVTADAAILAEGGSKSIVLELFTSQGCSGCPPADDLLSELLHDDDEEWGDLIPLAYHVTIWDYQGHKDPFSNREWDERQKLYAQELQPVKGVYTPQLVINGRTHVGGGSKIVVHRALDTEARRIRKAEKATAGSAISSPRTGTGSDPQVHMLLTVRQSSSGMMHVKVDTTCAGATAADEYALYAALYEHGRMTRVRKGENKGRTLHSDAVVVGVKQMAVVSGDVEQHTAKAKLPVPEGIAVDARLGVAVWLQHTGTLAIHGAVKAEL